MVHKIEDPLLIPIDAVARVEPLVPEHLHGGLRLVEIPLAQQV